MINAPRDRGYKAWTDPAEAWVWWNASGMGVETVGMDVRVRGRFRIAMRSDDGTASVVGGTDHDVEPPHRLVHIWRWESADPPSGKDSLVTIVLEGLGGTTQLAITHERFEARENADAHTVSWAAKLDGLVAYFDESDKQGEN